MLHITRHRSVYFLISAVAVGLSLAAWLSWGLKPGIDFTGGSLLEVSFSSRPDVSAIIETARPAVGEGEIVVQPLGEDAVVVRMPAIDEAAHQKLVEDLRAAFAKDGGTVEEKRFESIGPLIGRELQRKTLYAIAGAILAIMLYITFVFRKVSHPVASWKYGACTVLALAHDVAIPIGVLSALGHWHGTEVGAWVVTALLTVLGFSVHDTIVVFDRIREHLSRGHKGSFEDLVNRSLNETIVRSVNTSLTVLIVLGATWLLGGASIRDFVMTMFIGIAVGTYSSIFVASPALVTWHLHSTRKR